MLQSGSVHAQCFTAQEGPATYFPIREEANPVLYRLGGADTVLYRLE